MDRKRLLYIHTSYSQFILFTNKINFVKKKRCYKKYKYKKRHKVAQKITSNNAIKLFFLIPPPDISF